MFINRKKVWSLSWPLIIANFTIPLVGLTDTIIMGHMPDSLYLAAIAIGGIVFNFMYAGLNFLRMGTTGIVAQKFGENNFEEVFFSLLRPTLIAVSVGFIIYLNRNYIYDLSVYFLTPDQQLLALYKEYLFIRMIGLPAGLLNIVFLGWFFGMQKTKSVMLQLVIINLMNVFASLYLAVYLEYGIFGVALGTLIASYITIIIFSFYTHSFIIKKFKIIPKFEKLIIKSKLLRLFDINLNIFIRTLFLTFSFLWVTYLGSKLGEDYLAVNTILMQFIILAAFFLDAYAFSTEGIIGFTVGRKNKISFLSVVRNSIQLSFFTALIISIFYVMFFKQIVNIITDIEILRSISYKYFIWIIIIPPVASFCYQLDGIFIGASKTIEIRNAMIVSVLSFITISIYLTRHFGNHGLWFSLLLFMVLRALTLQFYFKKILRKF